MFTNHHAWHLKSVHLRSILERLSQVHLGDGLRAYQISDRSAELNTR